MWLFRLDSSTQTAKQKIKSHTDAIKIGKGKLNLKIYTQTRKSTEFYPQRPKEKKYLSSAAFQYCWLILPGRLSGTPQKIPRQGIVDVYLGGGTALSRSFALFFPHHKIPECEITKPVDDCGSKQRGQLLLEALPWTRNVSTWSMLRACDDSFSLFLKKNPETLLYNKYFTFTLAN